MQLPRQVSRLCVYVGESDRHAGHPVYEAIVLKARELGLAGATVTRGIMGFGGNSRLHTLKVLRLSEDLPILIEIIDRRDRIELILPFLDEVVGGGLVTLEQIEVLHYRYIAPDAPTIGHE